MSYPAAAPAATPPKFNARFPVYQIDFTAQATGKRVAGTKRRIRWRWGFTNQEALEQGKTGTSCRGEEHDVTIVWSVTSGKRQIMMDGHDVNYASARASIIDYSWSMRGNHVLKVIAHATPPISATPGFRQYDLFIDGQSFFDMPKVYELGLRGAPQAFARVPGDVGAYRQEKPHASPADQEEADLQRAIRESLAESQRHLTNRTGYDNNADTNGTTPAPVPPAVPSGDLLNFADDSAAAPAYAAAPPYAPPPPPAALPPAPPHPGYAYAPAPAVPPPGEPAGQQIVPFQPGGPPPPQYPPAQSPSTIAPPTSVPVFSPDGSSLASAPPYAQEHAPPAAPLLPQQPPPPIQTYAAPPQDPLLAPSQPVPPPDDPFAPRAPPPPTQHDLHNAILGAYGSTPAGVPMTPTAQPNFGTPQQGPAPTPGDGPLGLSISGPLQLTAEPQGEAGGPKTDMEKALNSLVNFDDISAPADREIQMALEKQEAEKMKNPTKSKGLPPAAKNMVGTAATLQQISTVKPATAPVDPSKVMKAPPPHLFAGDAAAAGALVVRGQGPPPLERHVNAYGQVISKPYTPQQPPPQQPPPQQAGYGYQQAQPRY